MEEILLQSVPNQNVAYVYGEYSYVFRVYTGTGGFTLVDIAENGTLIAAGVLCTPNTYILTQPTDVGNFKFVCTTNDYPYYKNFSGTQSLYFVPISEIE